MILMDVQMPEMDGLEATRTIRKLEKSNSVSPIKIISLTAYALAGEKEKCMAAGMDDYLSKPFKVNDLEEVVKRNFDGIDDVK